MGEAIRATGTSAGRSALALRCLLLATLLAFMAPAFAADGVARPVGDPKVEARVNKLSEELRCLTCMGQSIADSQSGFSIDMKREIRAMVVAGKSDKEIMEFMVQRYGDFVLYRPPVKTTTWLLWGGPFVLLVAGLVLLVVRLRRQGVQSEPELSETEHQQAAKLLGNTEENRK